MTGKERGIGQLGPFCLKCTKVCPCYLAASPGPFGQQKREPDIRHHMEGVSPKSKGARRTRGSMDAMGSGLGVRSCTSLGSWKSQRCWEVGEGSRKGWETGGGGNLTKQVNSVEYKMCFS